MSTSTSKISLGLDISTSITGISVISNKLELKKLDHVILTDLDSPYKKAKEIESYFLRLKNEFDIKQIFIEENLSAFQPGKSSASTIVTLARFNGIVSYLAEEVFSVTPQFLNVSSARKIAGCKIDKSDQTKKTKEKVRDWVQGQLPDFSWPTKILKSGPNKGSEILLPCTFDMADAYVIGLAGAKLSK